MTTQRKRSNKKSYFERSHLLRRKTIKKSLKFAFLCSINYVWFTKKNSWWNSNFKFKKLGNLMILRFKKCKPNLWSRFECRVFTKFWMFFPLNLILRLIQHQILVKFSSISELTISRSRPNLINLIQALQFSHPKTYSNIPRKTLTLNMKILQKPSNSVSIACHFSVNLTLFNIQKICINSQKKIMLLYNIFINFNV